MTNDIVIFNNKQFGQVRTLTQNNEPWFVLKDVCKALDLSTPSRVADRLDADEKGMSSIHTLGGNQNMTIVNESGLYTVILRSDKPQAKTFRKWVTSEVLPTIRKTGGYISDEDTFINMYRLLRNSFQPIIFVKNLLKSIDKYRIISYNLVKEVINGYRKTRQCCDSQGTCRISKN